MRASLMTVATAAVLALPAAQAALPSLTVPTFTMTYDGNPSDSADIGLVSTSATSTVLSLDGVEQHLQVDGSGMSWGKTESATTAIHFEAAAGYRITAIEFSTTVYGELAYGIVPPGALDIKYVSDPRNGAQVEGRIAGTASQVFTVADITNPTMFGGVLQNTAGLSAFDFSLVSLGNTWAGSVRYYVLDPLDQYGYSEVVDRGTAVINYLDPTLTVYTEALPVPEPGQWAMLAAGVSLLAGVGARRRKRAVESQ